MKVYFCYTCKNNALHVQLDGVWYCCCCDPTLLNDPILIGFTIADVLNIQLHAKLRRME